jgi:phage terminase large subunit-like protein
MNYFSATYTDFIKFDKKPNEDFYCMRTAQPRSVLRASLGYANAPMRIT